MGNEYEGAGKIVTGHLGKTVLHYVLLGSGSIPVGSQWKHSQCLQWKLNRVLGLVGGKKTITEQALCTIFKH